MSENPIYAKQFSEEYSKWAASQQAPAEPLLNGIESEFLRDFQLQTNIIYDVLRDKSSEFEKDDTFDVCRNCFVKFTFNPAIEMAMGPYCSPNCSLRANEDAYENGAITYKTYSCIIDKIATFFNTEGIRPFPRLTEFRGTLAEYHRQAPLPPGYSIPYYVTLREDSEALRPRETMDSMELS